MQTKEYTTIDRKGWPDGPWTGEPDKVQWQDVETGMPCLAVRHGLFGHWCGYVGVVEDHPLFDKHYDEPDVSVHGGLTFSGRCRPNSEDHGICHVPDPGETDKVWWFGFDCGHSGDSSPRDHMLEFYDKYGIDGSYRTLDYVRHECAGLAKQLA